MSTTDQPLTADGLSEEGGPTVDAEGLHRVEGDTPTGDPFGEFEPFAKIARLSRDIIITEKIDGTNAQVVVSDDGTELRAGSRTRWVTPAEDNYGFARWVEAHRDELLTLGPGRHFGEWWGQGIQRNYSMTEKRFSLFNVSRWEDDATRPACCYCVPVLYRGPFVQSAWQGALSQLALKGSVAAPGFMKPEGIVIFHPQGNVGFKKTIEKDEEPKGVHLSGVDFDTSQPSSVNGRNK